jgi:CBS domain-containing protein
MQLDLADSERTELVTALERQLHSLRDELVHTDDRDYRRSVRERLDRLEQVANRITHEQERAVAFEGRATRLSARSVMHTHPLTALPEDLVLDVSARMAEQGVRHMPVVDRAGHLIGIVSDRDVRQAIGNPLRLSADAVTPEALATLTVGAIMSCDPVQTTCDVPLVDLARLFVNRTIGAVPVVDDDTHVVGIVSYMDVLARLASARSDSAPKR